MVVGCLGDIVFEVSSRTLETIDNMTWSGSARYSVHQRHLTSSLTEFTGRTPDKITFNIILNAFLGVNPETEIAKIWSYERNGTAVPLVVGDKAYGFYRWNIVSHNTKVKTHDARGNIASATVSVTLQEYLRS